MAGTSYTTDYRLERVIHNEQKSTDEAVEGTFDNFGVFFDPDIVPYMTFFTTYPNGQTVMGAPFNYQPQAVYVIVEAGEGFVLYFTENYVTNGVVYLDTRVYSEELGDGT